MNDKDYMAPEVEIVLLETASFVAVSNLENPEEGDGFDWQ